MTSGGKERGRLQAKGNPERFKKRFGLKFSEGDPRDRYVARQIVRDQAQGVNVSALIKMLLFEYYQACSKADTEKNKVVTLNITVMERHSIQGSAASEHDDDLDESAYLWS